MRATNKRLAKWLAFGATAAIPLATLPLMAQSASTASNRADAETSANETSFDNVELVDSSLKGKIALLRVGSEPSANNLLSVFLGLKNKTERKLTVEMETIYKDENGKALNSGSWVALTLKPHEEKEYRSTSISLQFDPNAMEAHFLIRIRRAAAH